MWWEFPLSKGALKFMKTFWNNVEYLSLRILSYLMERKFFISSGLAVLQQNGQHSPIHLL